MNSYPIIKFPNLIVPYLNNEIPELKAIERPLIPKRNSLPYTSFIFALVTVLISISLFGHRQYFWAILVFASFLFLVAVLIGELQNRSSEFKRNMDLHKSELVSYDERFVKQQEIIKRVTSNDAEKQLFLKQRILELAKTSSDYVIINSTLNKKGKSELFFLTYLRSIFESNVFTDIAINENDLFLNYMPDFVFDNGIIKIDIEIDEPYVSTSFKPIHYYDEKTNEHTDTKRDNFFLQRNWCVIRFSEKQIFESPYSCCRVIANVIEFITGDNYFSSKLSHVEKIHKEEMWTKRMVQDFVVMDLRNAYKINNQFNL